MVVWASSVALVAFGWVDEFAGVHRDFEDGDGGNRITRDLA